LVNRRCCIFKFLCTHIGTLYFSEASPNLGDVIAERDDIFGDGVNVAARLEALAEPGGICISRTVREQIRDKLYYPFEDRGEQSFKNIARPVRVYAVRPETVADVPAQPVASIPRPDVAPRLSIVVLPFANLSDDREQQYFVDGITEDLTTDLSRIVDMFVISRGTAFTYRNSPVGTKQIGRELGVRYVLEGSVRRSGSRVRVNAQLIDAETSAHLWAERCDCTMADLFAMQDEITRWIAVALDRELVEAEAARPIEHPEALDYIFRGRSALSKRSLGSYAEAISLFEYALALDPGSVEAQGLLAIALMGRVLDGMSNTSDIVRAEELVGRALAASPRSPYAHYAKGLLLRFQHRYEDALSEFETVLRSNRNAVHARASLAQCKFYTGSVEEADLLLEQAIRLSPGDPSIHFWYFQIGRNHLAQMRVTEAILWLEKARSADPTRAHVHALLASAYALKDETERAVAELAEARTLSADDRYTSITRLRTIGTWGLPKIRALYEATYFAGLRKAGMPEE
jgi:TolB-like protein/cytochrome c-type biogenesis protein CcmH/NrfG